MRFIFAFFLLTIFEITPSFSTNFFIAPEGSNQNTGLLPDAPIQTIRHGFNLAEPGDTLFLLPGTYPGRNYIVDKKGLPDLPIRLISYGASVEEFAVIDAQAPPAESRGDLGILLQRSAWIHIENIIFRNCWTSVIVPMNSEYITVKSCHFSSGKRVINPIGHGAHHVLVDNCYIEQPDEVWQGWSWEDLHHGKHSHYNGGLLHPAKSGGGHIMRGSTIINLFNGFRTRPERISEDGNIEIYDNNFVNIRDNDFEPEGWAWNIHYHHNRHFNIHKAYSIDDVRGGNIYIFGNTHYQSKDAWALDEVSGIFKYKDGPLSYPCYAFNNSYYTEAKVLKSGEATNHLLKHFNNAYYFFQGSDRFRLDAWQPGYEFDYDCINQNWTRNITNNQQEQHGLEFTDPLFVDGANGNFQLQPTSLCIDAGKTMTLPELQWSQRFTGVAPDIGAYEGTQPTNGPPFRFIPSPEGTFYEELPRISQHLVADSTLILYFSAPLDTTAITTTDLLLFGSGTKIPVQEITFPNHAYEMYVTANQALSTEQLSLLFAKKPMGKNGLPFTYWGATIPIGESLRPLPDLSQVKALITSVTSVNLAPATLSIFPNPVRAGGSFVVSLPTFEKPTSDVFLQILSTNGQLLRTVELHDIRQEQFAIQLADELPQGVYVVRLEGWAGSHIGKLVVGQ